MANEITNILKLIIENPKEKFNIRKISQKRNINYKSAYESIKKLEQKKIIRAERFGNTTQITFTSKFNPLVFEVEYKRQQEILKNQDIKVLFSHIRAFEYPAVVLLFGSYGKKSSRKHSDIDLLVLTDYEKEIKQELSILPLPIHLNIFSYNDFFKMAMSREFNVVREAMKQNIILSGIEEYYRMIENVNRKTN